MAASADRSKPYIPQSGLTEDGFNKNDEATASCFCGSVQMVFNTKAPGLLTFVCSCTDCRKITASMFASNFVVDDDHVRFNRGEELLKTWAQKKSIASGGTMANHFCSNCGTLMFRVGENFPHRKVMRIGTVDDFNLHETVLRPQMEIFVKDRVSWFSGVEGVPKHQAML